MQTNLKENKLILSLKILGFIILASMGSRAFAEYYFVYPLPACPGGCGYRYVQHYPVKHYYTKHRSCCPVWVRSHYNYCGEWIAGYWSKRQCKTVSPPRCPSYTNYNSNCCNCYHYPSCYPCSTCPSRNSSCYDDVCYNPDLSTGDDDSTVDPEMQIN